jgi:hypothetical protein
MLKGQVRLEEKNFLLYLSHIIVGSPSAELISELKDTQARVWDEKKDQKVRGEYQVDFEQQVE